MTFSYYSNSAQVVYRGVAADAQRLKNCKYKGIIEYILNTYPLPFIYVGFTCFPATLNKERRDERKFKELIKIIKLF